MRTALPSRLALLGGVALAIGCGQKPTSIDLKPVKTTLYGKKSAGLNATVLDKKGQAIPGATIVWESSKPKVATVENGVVKAVNAGKTVITARLEKPPLSATSNIEVIDIASISLVPPRMTVAGAKGTTLPLKAEVRDSKGALVEIPVEWSTSNAAVASVDKKGVATSNAEGKATITAQLGDYGASTELRIIFRDIETFQAQPQTMLLKVGESQRINLIAKDKNGLVIDDPAAQWVSSDPTTATCVNGNVVGVSKGSATIKVLCGTHTGEVSVLVN